MTCSSGRTRSPQGDTPRGLDLQSLLALYRTRLAEKRTAISELQLGLLMITLPLTLHAGFMILAERHAVARVATYLPLAAFLLVLFASGLGLASRAVLVLLRTSRRLARLRAAIEQELGDDGP